MDWQWIFAILPWLFVLACPLTMFWMMRGMSHGESCKKTENDEGTAPATAARSTDEEIRVLKERLAHLEARNQPAENWS